MTQKLQKKSVLIKEEKNQIFNIPSESKNKIRGIQFNSIFWNIDGLPLNNDTTIKSIQKKQCIESLYKYIDAQNKNSVAILTLIETNIKENEKEFNQLSRHVVNPSKQLKGDGIILQTNYQQVTQTLTKLNNNKIQILRANLAHQHIIIINIHMDHNNQKKKEQFQLMEQIINNVESDKTCLGTVIQGDFNTDFSIQKEWEQANKLMAFRLASPKNHFIQQNHFITLNREGGRCPVLAIKWGPYSPEPIRSEPFINLLKKQLSKNQMSQQQLENQQLEWKDIEGFYNYEVSNLGQIRNKKSGRILKVEVIDKKYHRVSLSQNGIVTKKIVHHIVAKHFLPNPDNKKKIKHRGDILDNSANNLYYM
ncbi:hypothetical protein ABPG72_020089 [Tetrahymena utriculariae]